MENKQPKISTVMLLIVTLVGKNVLDLINGAIDTMSFITTLIVTIPFLLSMYFGEEKPGIQSLLNIFKTLTKDIAIGKLTNGEAQHKLEILIESAVKHWDDINQSADAKKILKEIKLAKKEIDQSIEKKVEEKLDESKEGA